jgi:hypothetical protein
MRDGEDQNSFFVFRIDQAVGEPAQPAAPYLIAEWMPGFGKSADPIDRSHCFQ